MAMMKDSGIEWIGEIPEDWEIKRIKYTSNIRSENGFFNPEKSEYIGLENIKSYSNEIIETETEYTKSFQSRCFKNDVMFNKLRPYLAKVLISPIDGFCTGELLQFYNFTGDRKYFFYSLLNPEFIDVVNSSTYGAKMPRANSDFILNQYLPLPPAETQKRIADFLDAKCAKIDSLKTDIQKQIETLEQYKKSVITEAVTKGINPNAKIKDSGSKWMPLIPEHWNMDKLKYNLTVHEIKGYEDKEVLSLYRELGIVPKNSRDDNHNVTSEDTSKYKYVRKGDFVINKMKAWQGSVAVSDYEGIVSPAYYVYEFITENYDKRYFHHLMRNKILADEFRRISGGIREGQWDLDRDQFENMYLPVPPKSEQIEIANFIDSKYGNIEKSVELKKQQLEKLEEYKKSLIFEYVTGKKEI